MVAPGVKESSVILIPLVHTAGAAGFVQAPPTPWGGQAVRWLGSQKGGVWFGSPVYQCLQTEGAQQTWRNKECKNPGFRPFGIMQASVPQFPQASLLSPHHHQGLPALGLGGSACLAPRRSGDWVVWRPPKCGFCPALLTQLVCPHSGNWAGGGVTSDLTAAWPTGSLGKGGGEGGRERPERGLIAIQQPCPEALPGPVPA